MIRRENLIRMRAAFRAITRDLVEEVIATAHRENERGAVCRDCGTDMKLSPGTSSRGKVRQAATATYVGRITPMTVESFINSLPEKKQAGLAALMVLGREQYFLTAQDVEAAADPASWTCDLGQYLASKGALPRYLQEGMRIIGI